MLVVYSDGVSEAVNPNGESLVRRVCMKSCRATWTRRQPAFAIASKPRSQILPGTPAADDITLVIVKREAEAASAAASSAG